MLQYSGGDFEPSFDFVFVLKVLSLSYPQTKGCVYVALKILSCGSGSRGFNVEGDRDCATEWDLIPPPKKAFDSRVRGRVARRRTRDRQEP